MDYVTTYGLYEVTSETNLDSSKDREQKYSKILFVIQNYRVIKTISGFKHFSMIFMEKVLLSENHWKSSDGMHALKTGPALSLTWGWTSLSKCSFSLPPYNKTENTFLEGN